MTKTEFAPVTPGEMLKEEFLADIKRIKAQRAA
jgi:plasmid maintenance system antidote protein VapI